MRNRLLLGVLAASAVGTIILVGGFALRGQSALMPPPPACPGIDRPVRAAAIAVLDGIARLECFGSDDITLEGQVTCLSATSDGGPGGPSWLDGSASCVIDEELALNGPLVTALLRGGPSPPNPVTGGYRVRGHFDDPEAATCSWLPIGVTVRTPISAPVPDAVMACRQEFVVTGIEPLS